jgi:hypothetical protein
MSIAEMRAELPKIHQAASRLDRMAYILGDFLGTEEEYDSAKDIGRRIYDSFRWDLMEESIAAAVYWPTGKEKDQPGFAPLLGDEQKALVKRVLAEVRDQVLYELAGDCENIYDPRPEIETPAGEEP